MSRFQEWMARRNGGEQSPLDTPRAVTFFGDRYAATKTEETISIRALVERIRFTRAPNKSMLPWLKLARFGNNRNGKTSLRNDPNVLEITGIEADYDGEQINLARAEQVLRQAGIAAMLYTSPSHTPEAPRWRILCPTSIGMEPDTRAGLVARINGLFVGALAGESFTLSQSYYFGAVESMDAFHEVVLVEGRAIDLADDLDDHAIGRAAKPVQAPIPPAAPIPRPSASAALDGASILGREALEQRCDDIRNAWDGNKHQAINTSAFAVGGLVSAGHIEEATAWAALREALSIILPRCKDARAAERTLRRAFQEGIGRPQHVEPPPHPIPEGPHPAAAFLAKLAARDAARPLLPAPPVAAEIMQPGGVLGMFMDHCNRTAMSPQPFLALGAGITMVGVLAGRRYRTKTDLRTNILGIGIADSGAGKDHARKQVMKCLFAANLAQYLGGSSIASGAGLRAALLRHPAMLFQIDEFGDFLKEVLGPKASTHKAQIAALLKELYSSANIPWRGAEYANQTGKDGKPREDIQQPHVCLYATTTPGQFWAAVAAGSLHDGLMARMLLFVSPCSYPDEQEPILAEPSDELIAALQAIAAGPEGQGNLAEIMLASTAPTPMTVPETPEASAAFTALRREQLERQRKVEGTYATSILGRWAENAMKLALIRAVSRSATAPEIQADDVAWGRALAVHCIDMLLAEAEQHVAENEYEARLNKAVEIIRKHGPITQRDMIKRGFKLPEKERGEILRTLIEGGLIVAFEQSTGAAGGRPTVRYAIGGSE